MLPVLISSKNKIIKKIVETIERIKNNFRALSNKSTNEKNAQVKHGIPLVTTGFLTLNIGPQSWLSLMQTFNFSFIPNH